MNESSVNQTAEIDALSAVAWGRAPTYHGRTINHPILCADGFTVSVQASSMHYAQDVNGDRPYWRLDNAEIAYPFTTFEVGYPQRGAAG